MSRRLLFSLLLEGKAFIATFKVIATKEAVIPATVGVDIGCGMMAVKTPFKSGILDGKLKDLRLAIEEAIPVGFNAYKESVDESSCWDGWKDFGELNQGVHDRKAKAMKQLGTLGGGNHFIEVCLDTEDFVWLMLHSGSRNIGKELAENFATEFTGRRPRRQMLKGYHGVSLRLCRLMCRGGLPRGISCF